MVNNRVVNHNPEFYSIKSIDRLFLSNKSIERSASICAEAPVIAITIFDIKVIILNYYL